MKIFLSEREGTMSMLEKLNEFFKNLLNNKPTPKTEEELINYFSVLEHYNFMDCDKNHITLAQLENYFLKEEMIKSYNFVRKDGKPLKEMEMFLEEKNGKTRSKFLKEKNASIFYLPVAKEEILRHFASQVNNDEAFQDNASAPNTFLLHIKLNHMLKIEDNQEQNDFLVVSPILKFFLKEDKTLEDLKLELEQSIIETIKNENYGTMDKNLLIENEEDKEFKKSIAFVHLRFTNWHKLTEIIQGVLKAYIKTNYINDENGVLRFAQSPLNEKHIKLTFDNFVGVNSFFLEDLTKIKSAIKKGKIGNALSNYLDVENWKRVKQSPHKTDFFSQSSVEEGKRILKEIPSAKWPSEYPLGLMQQVALNIILEKYSKEEGFIFSVNGPPGTGKTTLLKDIFANILLDKVKFLKTEENIISKEKFGQGDQDVYYAFHPKLKDYRILVASNNNAAVENISNDLPHDDTLLKEGYTFLGNDNTRWGKVSAAMGKRKNIEEFFEDIQHIFENELSSEQETMESLGNVEKRIEKTIKKAEAKTGFDDINDSNWQKSKTQYINVDEEPLVNTDRSILFGIAMNDYHKFIYDNRDKIKKNVELAKTYFLNGRNKANLQRDMNSEQREQFIQTMYDTIFLLSPILSTTFASVARFLKDLEEESIGWLFIDEAGQATPQAAVGAIWRSKRTIVVGDPLQVPPVVTLSTDKLKYIAEYNTKLDSKKDYFYTLARPEVSVQEFADLNNLYGGEMKDTEGNSIWLGSPLRVHRRCEEPMFTICNETTYQNKMIFGTKAHNNFKEKSEYQSQWIHVAGETSRKGDHFIEKQAHKALAIAERFTEAAAKECFIITPFVSVKQGLEKIHDSRKLKNVKIGTVHTFQGKEAPLVILVLGVADQNQGPLKWASRTPNLLNVAASRAKNHFIVIGNEYTWGNQEYFNVAKNELQKNIIIT